MCLLWVKLYSVVVYFEWELLIELFLAVLGFELSVSFLLGWHSTTSVILTALFCTEYFQDRIS
jgi:hypothetical protein